MSDITLTEVLKTFISGALYGLRVSLPGRIESYDPKTRRATVQALPMDGFVNEDGERKAKAIPPTTDVLVLGIGSGTVRVKIPIKKGSPCWLLFSSSSIARLKATGRLEVYDPGDDRRHAEADVVALPVPSFAEEEADDDAMIEFTDGGEIKAGGDEPLVTRSEFLRHTHVTAGNGAASPPTINPGLPGSTTDFPGSGKLRG